MPQADRDPQVVETAPDTASTEQQAQGSAPVSAAIPLDDAALDAVAAGDAPAPVQSPLVTVVNGVTGAGIRSFLPFGG